MPSRKLGFYSSKPLVQLGPGTITTSGSNNDCKKVEFSIYTHHHAGSLTQPILLEACFRHRRSAFVCGRGIMAHMVGKTENRLTHDVGDNKRDCCRVLLCSVKTQ